MKSVYHRQDGDILRCVETSKEDDGYVVFDRLEYPELSGATWEDMAKLTHRMRAYALTGEWDAVVLAWEGDYEDATLYVHGMRRPTEEELAELHEAERRRSERGPYIPASIGPDAFGGFIRFVPKPEGDSDGAMAGEETEVAEGGPEAGGEA